MAFAAMIGPIVSGVASLAGAMAQSSAMNDAADDEESIAHWNAARDREEASRAQAAGAMKSKQEKEQHEKAAGRARAARAQSGVAGGTGSALTLEETFAANSSYAQRVEMYNAENEKDRYLNKGEATIFEGKYRAKQKRAQAKATMISGFAGAAKSFGSAAASMPTG